MTIARISASQKIFERFERRKVWRRFIAVSYLTIYAIYLIWRCTVLNSDSIILSLLYLIAESCGFILGFFIIVRSWHYNNRRPKPVLLNRSVDIFIPVYKEPEHIIRRTLMAAHDIEYPHQTFVLDDGKRPEIKKIADELGIKYLSRDQNLHAKAGNLNYGLEHSQAEFVMVFDADHIAMPHALDVTLGFFADDKIGLVQTPQDYYNISAFQFMNCKKTGALWSDQSFFYNLSEPCYDWLDMASCVGTGVVYRRKTLDEIGGIPTATITEDTHTSLKMNKLGYKTVFLNESIAYGIASSDLSEYYKTRRRWTHGNIHVIREEKAFTYKGFSLHQRLMHISPYFNSVEGWQQLLLLFIPICTLFFGLSPFEISVFNVTLTFFFPFLSYLMLQELGCGFSRLWTNEIFSMIRWPIHLRASEAWIGRDLKWSSSIKNIKGKINWHLMMPQLFVLSSSICALIFAFYSLTKVGFKTGPLFSFFQHKFLELFGIFDPNYIAIDPHVKLQAGYTADLVIIAGAWVFYNIFRIIFFIKKVINDSKNSHEFYRFNTPYPVSSNIDQNLIGKISQISEEWLEYCHCISQDVPKIGERKKILLHLPNLILSMEIVVEQIEDNKISGTIIWDQVETRDQLAKALYSVDWHREYLNRNAYFLTPSDLLIKILTKKSPIENKYKEWNSLLCQGKPAVIAEFVKEKNLATMICFEEFALGGILSGQRIFNQRSEKIDLKIIAEEALSSLVERGLDGSITRRYLVEIL